MDQEERDKLQERYDELNDLISALSQADHSAERCGSGKLKALVVDAYWQATEERDDVERKIEYER